MKIAIMQPYLFPYISYFQLMEAVDRFVIYDDVNYIKRGWINRNSILINGLPSMFTVPLVKASQNKLINQIQINHSSGWQSKFLKTLSFAYKKAPYYSRVFPVIEEIVNYDTNILVEFTHHSIIRICGYLKIDCEIIISSDLIIDTSFHGQNRILKICKEQNANHYVNPIGGIEIYDRSYFKGNNITLSFLQSEEISYKQYDDVLVPKLSVIDVLMFNSKDDTNLLLKKYCLM